MDSYDNHVRDLKRIRENIRRYATIQQHGEKREANCRVITKFIDAIMMHIVEE